MPAACGRGWTGASADGIDFPTLVQRAGIAFASLTRFAEGVGRCYAVKRRRLLCASHLLGMLSYNQPRELAL
jgi:hypothetical protein